VRRFLVVILWGLTVALGHAAPVRFIDAATRLVVESSHVEVVDGQLTITAPGYRARSLPAFPDDGVARFVILEPEQPPSELHPDTIAQLHRADATVVLGYVGDAVTGRPLAGVSVASRQGTTVETDERGYFQIYLSCESDLDRGSLVFQKSGFQTQRRTDIELFPFGDWIYRIQLHPGEGVAEFVDKPPRTGVSAEPVATEHAVAASTSPTNSVIPRVPLNIRILNPNTSVLYYETLENYCKHSLPAEWFASWANYLGGSNSLNAGAVAVRTYAVGYVNSPRGTNHDICSTTSCQVYNPTVSSSFTDRAVDFTASSVMINANNAIPRGLTEYSAENNQLGMPCGDGFTAPTGGCLADPVCSGEPEFGHGRGLCQWGSIRWASGLKLPDGTNNGSLNGHPRQSWEWILNHYYPNLRLVRATPLALNNPVRVIGTSTPLTVRSCPGGTITNGVNCPSLGSQPLGSLGYIIAGPQRVTADGQGYTWWKVRWQNGIEGWSVENYLDRFIPTNSAPTITPVADLALHAGIALRMTNTATDADFPPNTLTFSLVTAPAGSGLHPSTGYLLWTLTATNAGTTNLFTVRVIDNGSPSLSATNSFRVRVLPPPQVDAALVLPNSVRLAWTSAPMSRYRVECADSLSAPTWFQAGGIVTATASITTITNSPSQQRFYRIVVID
jgi:hypothetical protein